MKKSVPELQVVLPYSKLLELLEAAQAVEDLRRENKRLYEQFGALRSQFTELMDVVGDLKRDIDNIY